MPALRRVLLACSQSRWLRERAPRYGFVRHTASRFMPGETVEEALTAALELQKESIAGLFTQLGENILDRTEAENVTHHYQHVLERVRALGLEAELSVKLTQLGLNLDHELCCCNLEKIVQCAGAQSVVWVDMETSADIDATLEIYRRARQHYPNVGVCLQAYLYRTARDLEALLPLRPAIRLVKGAYMEPPDRAFPSKRDVDDNFFVLAKRLLGPAASGRRAGIATHDRSLIHRVMAFAESSGLGRSAFEFQMLYGIQRAEQLRLAREGWRVRTLISYGSYWFPWFMRRLAERPANLMFVLRNLI